MKNSAIEWCHHTFNPWIGCTKVSPGCKHCYAAAQDHRWGHDRWGVGKPRERTSIANWRKPYQWNNEAAAAGERHRVFCASLADVFDAAVDPQWREDLFDLIVGTPQLDWLLLTKRPEAIIDLWPVKYGSSTLIDYLFPNIWLGTTVEDGERARTRVADLTAVPAAVHFLSCEPLLERIEPDLSKIDWVIAGGESGPGSRPMHIDWARSIRDQCARTQTPFLFKQWGEFDADGKRVGKKVSGRLLDGVQYDGYPGDVRDAAEEAGF